jgi:uncharacterized protein YbgA (DUF1722 family)
MEERIRMGVSACLLGQQVRYDGGHKHDRYITDILGEYLEFVAVCPEVEAGFPIPRETFIEQIFTLKRWRETMACGRSMKNLVDFHTRHKLLVLSHSPAHAKRMGKLVAEGKQMPIGEATTHYERLLIETLRLKTTVKKNMNVLEHILGYFKAQLSADEKQEVLEIFDRYRREFVPLIVPVTLLNHYVRKFDQSYLKQQVYLNPHPIALKLRNHV